MTDPTDRPPSPTELPPVDTVIHDARDTSWHLPADAPTERPAAGKGNTPGEPATPPQDDRAHAAPPTATSRSAASTDTAPVTRAAPAATHGSAAAGHGAVDAHAATARHGGGHDAHSEDQLGPVDVSMWGAGILAAAVGLFIAACFVLATSGTGAY